MGSGVVFTEKGQKWERRLRQLSGPGKQKREQERKNSLVQNSSSAVHF